MKAKSSLLSSSILSRLSDVGTTQWTTFSTHICRGHFTTRIHVELTSRVSFWPPLGFWVVDFDLLSSLGSPVIKSVLCPPWIEELCWMLMDSVIGRITFCGVVYPNDESLASWTLSARESGQITGQEWGSSACRIVSQRVTIPVLAE